MGFRIIPMYAVLDGRHIRRGPAGTERVGEKVYQKCTRRFRHQTRNCPPFNQSCFAIPECLRFGFRTL